MINRNDLSKFGIGSWGIGGFAKRNPDNDDEKQIDAIAYMLSNGINFLESGLWSAEGYAAKLSAKALEASGVQRDRVFLTQTIYPYTINEFSDFEKELDEYLRLFNTDYIDSFQLAMETIFLWGYKPLSDFMEKIFSSGRVHYISITNANLSFLKKVYKDFGDKLFAHEVCFNFEVRDNEDLGITKYADDNGILNVIYQPLRRNRSANHNWPLLIELSEKYGKTQNQILLNWIVSKDFFPITKSETIEHINEHLAAFDFTLEPEDKKRLDDFRVPGYKSPEIDWFRSGDGITVDQLSNVFDERYKNETL